MLLPTETRILYVDDESHNLESFKANFRHYYKIFTALSAAEAKTILDENDIHILITDQKMPDTKGTQLLEQAVLDYPQQIRIILTAYEDNKTLLDAFQRGLIFRYVLKPFQFEELKNLIDAAFEMYTLRKQKEELYNEWLKTNETLSLLKRTVISK